MLTRSKRIHEVRNQGATPFALEALLLLALPLLFTLQKLVALLLLGDTEYNPWLPLFLSKIFIVLIKPHYLLIHLVVVVLVALCSAPFDHF